MDTYDVARKLLGCAMPVGSSYEDAERLRNLEATTDLVDRFIADIYRVAECRSRQEHSMKKAGVFAYEFLRGVADEINKLEGKA